MAKLIIIPLGVWLISFILKRIIDLFQKRDRYMHYGGWPSTHSSIVSSLAIVMALEFGLASAEFAISIILAAIVITDAIALRPLISQHSKIINASHDKNLPEQVGHNLNEIFGGVALAIILSLILYQIL